MFVAPLLLQFLDYKFVSIFQGIFCPSFKMSCQFGPFFEPFIITYKLKQFDIFLLLPEALFELRVEVAVPVFFALFGISVDFVLICVESIEFL